MRIGFDVDGVLANFIPSYQRLIVETTGVDLFQPGDNVNPPCWSWPEYRGYTDAQLKEVFRRIRTSENFWLNLDSCVRDNTTLRLMIPGLEKRHDVYFVTNRSGETAKRQSELWLLSRLGYPVTLPGRTPTVLISSQKGAVARALKLDFYVDDHLDNAIDVATQSPQTRMYLLDKSYNHEHLEAREPGGAFCRVKTLGDVFDRESESL